MSKSFCIVVILIVLCFVVYHTFIQNKMDSIILNIEEVKYDVNYLYEQMYELCTGKVGY
jgi:septation ring formation regulator EzrA